MAKGNRRLRSVVEGAVEASRDARRAAAAEKIRAAAGSPVPEAPSPPTPEPVATPAKPKRTRQKPAPTEVEPDMRLEANVEQRVPESATQPPTMTPEQARQLRETMLQSSRPKRRQTTKPQPAKPTPAPGNFAPIRGPGALLGRLLKETYRQAPNIAANAVAIPAFTAAGAGGIYLGTAATVGAIRGIGKLLSSPSEPEPTAPPQQPAAPDDYKSSFQRAIDERRKSQPPKSSSNTLQKLFPPRGLS